MAGSPAESGCVEIASKYAVWECTKCGKGAQSLSNGSQTLSIVGVEFTGQREEL